MKNLAQILLLTSVCLEGSKHINAVKITSQSKLESFIKDDLDDEDLKPEDHTNTMIDLSENK